MDQQAIMSPLGVTVFGSATIRVAPDIAIINFTSVTTQPTAAEAFKGNREASQKIQGYLSEAKFRESGVSQVNLEEALVYENGAHKFIGYRATTSFRVILRDLTQLTVLLEGVVDAGASRIQSIAFQTSQLKTLRVEARQKAFLAAREKAEEFCAIAGVKLGKVIHIEDNNPDPLQRQNRGHEQMSTPAGDEQDAKAFDPSSIAVVGAVVVAFAIE